MKRGLFTVILLLTLLAPQALAAETTVLFFYGEGCPHCAKEAVFLNEILDKYPDLEILAFETFYNGDNHDVFEEMSEKYNTTIQGVPTLFINDTVIVGYEENMNLGIEYSIRKCIDNTCISPVDVLSEESKAIAAMNAEPLTADHGTSSGKGLVIFFILVIAIVTAVLVILYVSKKK